MKKPHKHAEIIKAWADGAEIQHRPLNSNKAWGDTLFPGWYENWEYRVKPEPKPDVAVKALIVRSHEMAKGWDWYAPDSIYYPANIQFIFDGETGKLKSAEVL